MSSQNRGLFCSDASHIKRMSLVGFLSQSWAWAAGADSTAAHKKNWKNLIAIPPCNKI
jgi:hypothetical protein